MKLTVNQLRRIIREEVARATVDSFDIGHEELEDELEVDVDEEAFEEEAAEKRAAAVAARREAEREAAKSLLLEPSHRKEIVPLLNAKRSKGAGTKAGKAASAAITNYIADAFPDLDPISVHSALTAVVDQMYGRR